MTTHRPAATDEGLRAEFGELRYSITDLQRAYAQGASEVEWSGSFYCGHHKRFCQVPTGPHREHAALANPVAPLDVELRAAALEVLERWDGYLGGDFGMVPSEEQVARLRAALANPVAPLDVEAAFNDVTKYDERRREVAAMIEEADLDADDGVAGPDAIADALMELALGWLRAAAQPDTAGEPE